MVYLLKMRGAFHYAKFSVPTEMERFGLGGNFLKVDHFDRSVRSD